MDAVPRQNRISCGVIIDVAVVEGYQYAWILGWLALSDADRLFQIHEPELTFQVSNLIFELRSGGGKHTRVERAFGGRADSMIRENDENIPFRQPLHEACDTSFGASLGEKFTLAGIAVPHRCH